MHKFFHFANLKSTFSILHIYFYKTPTSVCLFYTFIQIKYSFLYPHSHWPTPTIHTGITLESTQPTGRKLEKQTQQNGSKPTPESTPRLEQNGSKWYHTGIDASPWATRSTPPVTMARTRNKIDASKGKRWRWRETFNPIQPKTHWSSPFNPKTTRNKGRKSDWRRRQWRSTEARGRKIDERKKDWSDERKIERAVRWERERERERGSWELGTERREKKWLKNYMHMLQYPCIFAQVL